MSKKRKSPIEHPVTGHTREGKPVSPYIRGSGTKKMRKSRVVGVGVNEEEQLIKLAKDEGWIYDSDEKDVTEIRRVGFDKWLEKVNKHTEDYKRRDVTVVLRNPEQAIIWSMEYIGQISDGIWENDSRFMPRRHRSFGDWIYYSDAKIGVDPENVGFSRAGTVPVAGPTRMLKYKEQEGRLLFYVRNTVNPEYTRKDLRRDLRDLSKILKTRRKK